MAFNLEDFAKKYAVHEETIRYLSAKYKDGVKQGYESGIEGARIARIQGAKQYGGTVHFEGREQELLVPSPFSKDTPCIVVNVEYRLAPEHKFPDCQNDAKCVVEWVAAHRTELGGAPASRLAVCGDSAGGRIAAVVCHEVKHLIDLAVLVYPGVNFSEKYPSEFEFIDGPALSKPVRDWYTSHYLRSDADRSHVRASPILNTDFSDLPPTLVIVAELDPLRDGGYAYHEKLKEAGVETELLTIKGVPHGFWSLPGAFHKTCQEAHSAAVRFLQRQSF